MSTIDVHEQEKLKKQIGLKYERAFFSICVHFTRKLDKHGDKQTNKTSRDQILRLKLRKSDEGAVKTDFDMPFNIFILKIWAVTVLC